MVIKNKPPRYPRRGPSCSLVLVAIAIITASGYVMANRETVREAIIPTPVPSPSPSATDYAILASLSEEDGDYDQAIDYYQTAIRLDATKPELFVRLIDLLVREQRPEDALRTAEQVTILTPDNDRAWLAMAAAYIANGDRLLNKGDSVEADLEYDKAANAAERALAINETSLAYAYAAGGIVLQQNAEMYEQAQIYADNALVLDPNNAIARLYMGKVFELQQADYAAAIEQYQLGIESDPTLADLYIELAFNYYATGDTARAINSFEDAVAVDPDNAAAYDGIAFMYLQLGQDALAIENGLEAVRLDPQMARAHGRLGQAYFRQFNYPKAIEELETAVELYGEVTNVNAPFFSMLGQSYIRNSLNECPQAVPIFQEVLTVNSLATADAEEGIEECRRSNIGLP
jgi:superkiller protein 3